MAKKNAPLRRSQRRHDQAPNKKSGRGAQSGGIRLARFTLRILLPSFCQNFGRFRSKPDTQLRVSPCFGSRTQPACPFPIQGFSRCEGISFTPALNKDQHSRGSRPKNDKIISLPLSPRQRRPNWHSVSDTQCQIENPRRAANPVWNSVRFPSPLCGVRCHG